MQFKYVDLKQCKRGDIVEIDLAGTEANVFLVDSANFANYKNRRRYRYYGGHTKTTPVHLTVPSSGHWYAVADLGGSAGRLGMSARVLPGALPALRQPNLRSVIQDVVPPDEDLPDATKEHDLFISHATEDKPGIVSALVQALQARHVNVWYAEFELRVGDSLRRKIDQGLARSRFGLLVVSPSFFAKNWTQYELDGLVALEMAGRQRILPVWHEVTKDEVLGYSPSLADKVALSTGAFSVEEIATEIASVVKGDDARQAA